jgi:hypothetical protein
MLSLFGTGSVSDDGPVHRDPYERKGLNLEEAHVCADYTKHRDDKGRVVNKTASVSAKIKLNINGQIIPIKLDFTETFKGGSTVGDMLKQLRHNGKFKSLVLDNIRNNEESIEKLMNLKLKTKDGRVVLAREVWDQAYKNYKMIEFAYENMPVPVGIARKDA